MVRIVTTKLYGVKLREYRYRVILVCSSYDVTSILCCTQLTHSLLNRMDVRSSQDVHIHLLRFFLLQRSYRTK
jgi:hypothetical protein